MYVCMYVIYICVCAVQGRSALLAAKMLVNMLQRGQLKELCMIFAHGTNTDPNAWPEEDTNLGLGRAETKYGKAAVPVESG